MPAPDCLTELEKIYNAIISLQTGQNTTSISFGERSVTYTQAQVPSLITLYRTFWNTCGRGTAWPNMAPAAAVERGPPGRVRGFY